MSLELREYNAFPYDSQHVLKEPCFNVRVYLVELLQQHVHQSV